MKYTTANPPKKCFMRQSTWYKSAGMMKPLGVLWHSTGANNPTLKRYVQPDDNAQDRIYWENYLGDNVYGNDWNHIQVQAGVNAFIGKAANGEVTTIQVGEWNRKPWGCGSGPNGSCNNTHIQFEICEDAMNDANYFNAVYREACELTAYLCKLYGLNPHGTIQYNGVTVPVILCHHDSYKLGLGTGHIDIDHWFPKFGKSMQTVRDDVASILRGEDGWPGQKEDDVDMTLEELMSVDGTGDHPDSWAKPYTDWSKEKGIFNGDGQGNYGWQKPISREAVAIILKQYSDVLADTVAKRVLESIRDALEIATSGKK